MNKLFNILMVKLRESKQIRNASWLVGEQVFQMLVSLIVGILTARYLGPDNYGSLNYTASFVTFFSSIATLGMDGVVIKKMIATPDKEGVYLGSCMFFRLISSVTSTVMIIGLIYVLNPNEPIKIVLALLQSLQLIFQSVYILDAWFQRYLKSKYVSIGKMIACIVVALYKIYLLLSAKSVVWFALSNSLTYIVVSLFLYIFYKKENGQKLRLEVSKGKEVLSESYHFILSGLMTAIYSQMDKIMIGEMLSDTDVGLYTTATSICGMWIFIPIAIINSFRPSIMEIKRSGNEELYITRLEQLYSTIIWLCIMVSSVVFLFAPLGIQILYGDAYIGATDSLRIAIWSETFAMIGTARGIWILCENKNKYVKYYLAIGAVVNVVLNAIMIPIRGIEGAAFATLITQITTSLLAPLLFKETRVHTKIVLEAFFLKWYFKTER